MRRPCLIDGLGERFGALDYRFERMEAVVGEARNEILAAYRGELITAVSGQTRAIIFAMAGTAFSIGGLAVGLAQFG